VLACGRSTGFLNSDPSLNPDAFRSSLPVMSESSSFLNVVTGLRA
jgi:hypothetical protein